MHLFSVALSPVQTAKRRQMPSHLRRVSKLKPSSHSRSIWSALFRWVETLSICHCIRTEVSVWSKMKALIQTSRCNSYCTGMCIYKDHILSVFWREWPLMDRRNPARLCFCHSNTGITSAIWWHDIADLARSGRAKTIMTRCLLHGYLSLSYPLSPLFS